MLKNRANTIEWLKEIGDSIPVSPVPTHLILNPVQPRKKAMAKKQTSDLHKVNNGSSPSQENIRNLVKDAKSLDDLKQILENFDGCELKKLAQHTVFGDGNPESKIMLIGEAPGAEEDKQGLPFVGASGQLLDQMFKCIGLDRTKFYITNIIPWRPPGNRNPTAEEISMCLPFVEKRIELIQPKIIIMIGGVAAKSLLNTDLGIMRLRGHWHEYQLPTEEKTIEAFAIYHPSYLLRSPGQKQAAWHDLLLLKKRLKELDLLPNQDH